MATDTPPHLPTELWQMVVPYLGEHDLRSLRAVNRLFASIVRPLLYRYCNFSRLGYHFPGAAQPYPFLELPELQQAPLSKKQRASIFRNITVLKLRKHDVGDCTTFRFLQGYRVFRPDEETSLDVLWVELFSCPTHAQSSGEMYSTFVHEGDEGHRNPTPDYDEDGADEFATCRHRCFYIDFSSLWCARPRKLVFRNAPVLWFDGPDSPLLFPNDIVTDECVLVVNSAALDAEYIRSERPWEEPLTGFCSDGRVSWGFQPGPPWRCERLTIVFWTGSPDEPWFPPCTHYADEDPWELEEPGDCTALARMWFGLGSAVRALKMRTSPKDGLKRITVVNADAVRRGRGVEGETQEYYENDISARFEAAFKARGFPECEPPELECVTFDAWLAGGHAENVFSHTEIAPFLAAGGEV